MAEEERDLKQFAELLVQIRPQSNFDKRLLLGVLLTTSEITTNQEQRPADTSNITIATQAASR